MCMCYFTQRLVQRIFLNNIFYKFRKAQRNLNTIEFHKNYAKLHYRNYFLFKRYFILYTKVVALFRRI